MEVRLDVRPPKELGGAGGAANPELLFAAAWAACFNGALQLIMKAIEKAGYRPGDDIICKTNDRVISCRGLRRNYGKKD